MPPAPSAKASSSSAPMGARIAALAALVLLGACGSGGGGGGGSPGLPGEELAKPGGGTYFVDPNHSGRATRIHLAEMFWARLVDVHDVDAQGNPSLDPVFRDFTISENVNSDSLNYRLDTNPITQKTRLVVLRQRGVPDAGLGTFESLLRSASLGLPPILPKNDDGSNGDQYSFVARNATIVMRFDDLLDDREEAQRNISETIRILAGYPPITPFSARLIFDPNYGGVVNGEFHSTRVLVDLTVSESESSSMLVAEPINAVGLPPSVTSTTNPNVSIRIPTRTDFGSGQFELLRGLSGSPLSFTENGPADRSSPAREVVRAMRSGNSTDLNNGFLLDLSAPQVIGGWNMRVDTALDDPQGRPGFDYLLDATFTTVCRAAAGRGDVVSIGDTFLEVAEESAIPDVDGLIQGLRVHTLGDQPLAGAGALTGNALFLRTYHASDPVPTGCWVNITPQPTSLPATGVATNAQVLVRFSEPMDPESLSPFDNFFLVSADASTVVGSRNLVVGEINPSSDLKEFTFVPTQHLPHNNGVSETYHLRVQGPTDLAGNALVATLPTISFEMAPGDPTSQTGGVVLRFGSTDEAEPVGFPDLRGQFFYDFDREVIRPRPAALTSYPADRTNPVPAIMVPIPGGVQTPLSSLGSKLQTVWRYCDLGWQVLDETKYNLDVIGLAWAPVGGSVINDFFERFEILLAHSRRLPDEAVDSQALLPKYTGSGLGTFFAGNVLIDPLSPQIVAHPRTGGYQINSADLFLSTSNTVMLPYPLNRNVQDPVTYVWRDTAVVATGGPSGVGIPLDVEAGPPTNLEDDFGYVADANVVPSFGLPLLIEYRCFPSSTALGLNSFDISIALNSSAIPAFRAFSTGGIDRNGLAVQRNPDTETTARGGFNPAGNPPGSPTLRGDDNVFYIGQLDVVTRLSRVHSAWIDTGAADADFLDPVVLPSPADQPTGTNVVVEFRGSNGFLTPNLPDLGQSVDETTFPFDSTRLNAYGEIFARVPQTNANLPPDHRILGSSQFPGSVFFVNDVNSWSADIDTIDTARYFQLRITFVSNIQTGLSPELSAIGIPFSRL